MLKMHEAPDIEEIQDPALSTSGVRLYIKREDKIHPNISGNKWRKLKYNLEQAKKEKHTTLLTFGGAFSNHIYATAAAAKEYGFKSIGIIRGEQHSPLNPTLAFAEAQGMLLDYMDRETYRRKASAEVLEQLRVKYGEFYLLPEGGTNHLAIQGAREIVDDAVLEFDYVCVPVGTGGTIAGIISGMQGNGKILGYSALKGSFIVEDVKGLLLSIDETQDNWMINTQYHFGGYAKVKNELLDFIMAFKNNFNIPLDPVYTGKMMFGIYDMVKKGEFRSGSKILAIHTGGLQGIEGMKTKYPGYF